MITVCSLSGLTLGDLACCHQPFQIGLWLLAIQLQVFLIRRELSILHNIVMEYCNFRLMVSIRKRLVWRFGAMASAGAGAREPITGVWRRSPYSGVQGQSPVRCRGGATDFKVGVQNKPASGKFFFVPPLFQMWGYKQANISRGLLNIILKFAVWFSH